MVLVVSWLSWSSVARAETPVPGEDERLYSCNKTTGPVAVTFKPDTELKDVVTWVMGFTCKDFVFDQRVVVTGKKVTIIAPQKMDAATGYRVFLAALRTINLTVIPSGNMLKIVDSSTAKHEAVPIVHTASGDSDDYVRYVYHPSYAPADQLVKAFLAVKSDPGEVVQIGPVLVMTDYASHIHEMMAFATLIDVPTGTDAIYTIHVEHADATRLAEKVNTILGTTPTAAPGPKDPAMAMAATQPLKLVVDERTNTLIVAASNPAYERVRALVERLDIALDIDGGQAIHVYPLHSTIAEELALTLTTAVTAPTGQQKQPGAPATPAPATSDSLGANLEGKVRIIADKPSNKLIVISSGRDYLAVQDVIRQLDVPRRQVYIEAMILEVQLGSDLTLGASYHGGIPVGGGLLAGGLQMPNLKSTDINSLAASTGLIGALVSTTNVVLGTSIPSYGVLINALSDTSNTNILSEPSIIALDNDEAKFKVGTNIPYVKGTLPALPGTTSTALATNVDRKDLAIELDIKPHITNTDSVLLEIKHEANDLGDNNPTLGPSWTTRSFETKVTVRDQQTIVLGGMMQEREINGTSKIPLLGDIPILGHLFSYTTKTKRKTNLLILITPYIIQDQLDLERIRERKTREHDEFVRSFHSLEHARYEPRVDYGHKRGLIEEINRSVVGVEEDRGLRDGFTKHPSVITGPVQQPAPLDTAAAPR